MNLQVYIVFSCVNTSELKKYEIEKQHMSKLEDYISMLLKEKLKSNKDKKHALIRQQKQTEKRLESLEEKYIVGDIAKDMFEKYSSKYRNTLDELVAKIDNPAYNSSNFKKAIYTGVEMASNLTQLWVSSDYSNKQKLQYIVFPEGLLYNKKNDTVRTPQVNSVLRNVFTGKHFRRK
jgi:hypothetical protein